jgi:glycyl-tRNA synthetase beta chain
MSQDLLFELGTEELPPLSLETLSRALADGITAVLGALSIEHGTVRRYATPRRLAVLIERVAERSPDRVVERRGPPLTSAFDAAGKPTQAAIKFAQGCGVEVGALERLTIDKGAWLVYRGTQPGADTASVLGRVIAQAVSALPIARRMRWGAGSAEFVRPVHRIVLLFGTDVLPIEVLGLTAGRLTEGHRFHAPRPISLSSPAAYVKRLERARVVASFEERRARINAAVSAAAVEAGGTALVDEALLDEVTALVEWPVPIVGRFEARFLALPREVVIATIKDHQRYFPIEGPEGKLTDAFVTVSNIESKEPDRVREGNERVVRPRLADAAFFWEQDLKQPLAVHAERLGQVVFQTRLGSFADKSARLKVLALELAAALGLGQEPVARAAALAKADLMTQMVGEFPELQGVMGRYYALEEGVPPQIAQAIEEHYRPRFAGDELPGGMTGRVLALADRIDTLTGIFAIEERPSGTKDPFGLRRAALGVLRILVEGGIDLDLQRCIERAAALQSVQRPGVVEEASEFINERLKGYLIEREGGVSIEMVEAVLALRPRSPLDALARLRALRDFLGRAEAAQLVALNKRIANILRKAPAGEAAARASLTEPVEQQLADALEGLGARLPALLEARRYTEALHAAIALGEPIEAFFNGVMVMDEDPARRSRRLSLLREAQRCLMGVADLSRLPG